MPPRTSNTGTQNSGGTTAEQVLRRTAQPGRRVKIQPSEVAEKFGATPLTGGKLGTSSVRSVSINWSKLEETFQKMRSMEELFELLQEALEAGVVVRRGERLKVIIQSEDNSRAPEFDITDRIKQVSRRLKVLELGSAGVSVSTDGNIPDLVSARTDLSSQQSVLRVGAPADRKTQPGVLPEWVRRHRAIGKMQDLGTEPTFKKVGDTRHLLSGPHAQVRPMGRSSRAALEKLLRESGRRDNLETLLIPQTALEQLVLPTAYAALYQNDSQAEDLLIELLYRLHQELPLDPKTDEDPLNSPNFKAEDVVSQLAFQPSKSGNKGSEAEILVDLPARSYREDILKVLPEDVRRVVKFRDSGKSPNRRRSRAGMLGKYPVAGILIEEKPPRGSKPEATEKVEPEGSPRISMVDETILGAFTELILREKKRQEEQLRDRAY